MTMRGIRRNHGAPQLQARSVMKDDLITILNRMDTGLSQLRDRAMLLIGFCAALRRSELVALNLEDVEQVREGVVLIIRRSMTDQEGLGRRIGIPYARSIHCPVLSLNAWCSEAGIFGGAIFRRIDRHGRVLTSRLSGNAVSQIIKKRACAAGYDPSRFSGLSLRAGLATRAAQAGVPSWKIRAQTGHKSDAMLQKYIRDGELFINNAAGAVF